MRVRGEGGAEERVGRGGGRWQCCVALRCPASPPSATLGQRGDGAMDLTAAPYRYNPYHFPYPHTGIVSPSAYASECPPLLRSPLLLSCHCPGALAAVGWVGSLGSGRGDGEGRAGASCRH